MIIFMCFIYLFIIWEYNYKKYSDFYNLKN